jgi:hypothetical protein
VEPATSTELAARTGIHERYAREWLEQQSITGLLTFDDASQAAQQRVYSLPSGYESVLADTQSPLFMAHFGRMLTVGGGAGTQPAVGISHRFGVSWSAFGDDMRTAQGDFNRVFFLDSLVPDYLSQIKGLDEALRRQFSSS